MIEKLLGGGNISLDSITRSDVNDSSKYLYGQFYIKIGKTYFATSNFVTMTSYLITTFFLIAPSRTEVSQKARLWATEIYKQLSKDWPQYPFTVTEIYSVHVYFCMFVRMYICMYVCVFKFPEFVCTRCIYSLYTVYDV